MDIIQLILIIVLGFNVGVMIQMCDKMRKLEWKYIKMKDQFEDFKAETFIHNETVTKTVTTLLKELTQLERELNSKIDEDLIEFRNKFEKIRYEKED